jgi:hypothetical protein
MYGGTDAINEERAARQEAVKLLLQVALGTRTRRDVVVWLEVKYPDLYNAAKKK